jgi:hypothetical protein
VLTDLTYLDLEYICLNLRQADKSEVFALRPHDNPLQLALEAHAYIRNQGRGKIAWINGRPAAVAAFTEDWPGVWSVWMFGTDDFKAAAIPLVRWARKEAKDILSICAGHRLQCDSAADHHEAHALIKAMGAKEEYRMRRYGKHGDDFIRFVWLNGENDAVLKPHYQRPKEA